MSSVHEELEELRWGLRPKIEYTPRPGHTHTWTCTMQQRYLRQDPCGAVVPTAVGLRTMLPRSAGSCSSVHLLGAAHLDIPQATDIHFAPTHAAVKLALSVPVSLGKGWVQRAAHCKWLAHPSQLPPTWIARVSRFCT
jgi:hypothetical protein